MKDLGEATQLLGITGSMRQIQEVDWSFIVYVDRQYTKEFSIMLKSLAQIYIDNVLKSLA